MRHVDLLASVISAIRKGADDHAIRLKAAEERAIARAQEHDERLGKLSADVGDLADATRAVLLRQRDPQVPVARPAPPAGAPVLVAAKPKEKP